MAAVTKASLSILAAVSVPPGGTKAAPATGGTGAWVDVTGYNGGLLGGRIKNTGGSLGAQGQMTWQWTPDKDVGTPKVYDLHTWGGDMVGGTEYTASIRLDKEVKFVRAICYGHITNAVTFESDLAASN